MATMPPIPRHIIIKHEGDIIEVSNSNDDDDEMNNDDGSSSSRNTNNANARSTSRPRNKYKAPKNLPLVDEIDLQQCLVSPSAPWQASAIQGVVIGKEQLEVICNHRQYRSQTIDGGVRVGSGGAKNNNDHFQACPCCRRFIQMGSAGDTMSGDDAAMNMLPTMNDQQPTTEKNGKNDEEMHRVEDEPGTGALTSLWTSLTMTPQPMAAPPLTTGDQVQDYTITEAIVQGWLYKKGTGGDWAGRRWWKPRWVTLALAQTPNSIVPAPCLISHRAPGVPYPASVTELTATTVIMAIERTHSNNKINAKKGDKRRPKTPNKEWNRHCFQIVHTHHRDNETTPKTTTRIFTAPVVERNEWVFAMNNALMGYEKRLSKARSDAAKVEYNEAQHTKKARRSGFDGLKLCGELTESEQMQNHEEKAPSRNPSWTVNDNSGRGRSIHGAERMRSLSPAPRVPKALMGLPPTSPRRGTVAMRSPSPSRFASPIAGRHRPLDSSSRSITP